jgi:hypothetical protein
MSVESYKHKAAKSVLAGWLREPILAGQGDYLLNGDRPNRYTSKGCGVHEEYPICLAGGSLQGANYCWDELGWQLNEENGLGRKELVGETLSDIPTYRQCIKLGMSPIVIFDVMTLCKGEASNAYEVVHKNPVSAEKKKRLQQIFKVSRILKVHVIDAEWILSQVRTPSDLKTQIIARN